MPTVKRRDGSSYHTAMALCPTARSFELRHPLEIASLRSGDVIVDFPSAGSYLTPYAKELCPGATLHAVEHVPDYVEHDETIMTGNWDQLPFADGSVDVVVTLAALHHLLSDRTVFYDECRRALRPDGRLIIADVEAGTPPDRFLNEFVGLQSSAGHEAEFMSRHVEEPRLRSSGFEVEQYDVRAFQWTYPDKETAIEFCRGLFRLDRPSDGAIWQGLNDYLGVEVTPREVRMNWQLAFVLATPRTSE